MPLRGLMSALGGGFNRSMQHTNHRREQTLAGQGLDGFIGGRAHVRFQPEAGVDDGVGFHRFVSATHGACG